MKPHPLCIAFPPMSDADFDSLCQDIQANGLREPIVLFENQIIDGWHRFQACASVNVTPRFTEFDGIDPPAFVLSKNLHRRHLSASQRAIAVVACREWRPNGGSVRNITDCSTESDMAKEANVSPKTISDAKVALRTGQTDAVRDGKISVSKAAASVRPSPEKEPELSPLSEEDAQPDIATEFLAVSAENDRLQELNASLLKDDSKAEIRTWKEKFDGACGRIQQLMTTEAEMKKTLNYQGNLLAEIRKVLGVEKTSEILSALKEVLGK